MALELTGGTDVLIRSDICRYHNVFQDSSLLLAMKKNKNADFFLNRRDGKMLKWIDVIIFALLVLNRYSLNQ